MRPPERVAVIGSGVMGAGVAAQVANAGIPVTLLDVVPRDAKERDQLAREAIRRMLDSGGLMHRDCARLMRAGNLEDDFNQLAEADWIIEAVVENLEIKRDLYRRIAAVRRPDAAVSSNTSTLPLATLGADLPEDFRRHFLITHFFNPPRHTRLLELVGGPEVRPEVVQGIAECCDRRLGKSIVRCNDGPGFIANRIGVYWMLVGLNQALHLGMRVEEADALFGRPLGIPKTGIFGLYDLIGIDLMLNILGSMSALLAEDDALQQELPVPAQVQEMVAQGRTGRKGGGGFYRLRRGNGGKSLHVLDLQSWAYRAPLPVTLDNMQRAGDDLQALLTARDRGGRYAWNVLARTLLYSVSLVPRISDDYAAVDTAMRLGYNWTWGPFELIDRLGASRFVAELQGCDMDVPEALHAAAAAGGFYRQHRGLIQVLTPRAEYRPVARLPDTILLDECKRRGKPAYGNRAATLWDIGEGVACLEFHTKMNAIRPDTLEAMVEAVAVVGRGFRALVIYNDGRAFSAGADLGVFLALIDAGDHAGMEALIRNGQSAMEALKRAPFPVVAAVSGVALGGGCEVLLHCDAIQAHAETRAGLVEINVGVLPAWGGCREMLLRHVDDATDPRQALACVFDLLALARTSGSALEAREMHILREHDRITMNRDRLLADARALALERVEAYTPPAPRSLCLPGAAGKQPLLQRSAQWAEQGLAGAHDRLIHAAMAEVLCAEGAPQPSRGVDEAELAKLEREAFVRLLRTPATRARIECMLQTGKRLQN